MAAIVKPKCAQEDIYITIDDIYNVVPDVVCSCLLKPRCLWTGVYVVHINNGFVLCMVTFFLGWKCGGVFPSRTHYKVCGMNAVCEALNSCCLMAY